MTFGDAGLCRLLTSRSSMTAMWGDAARQVQLLLAAVLSAPVLADLLRLACVQVRALPEGAVLEHGQVRLHAVLLDDEGGLLQLGVPPSTASAAARRLRVERVVLAKERSET